MVQASKRAGMTAVKAPTPTAKTGAQKVQRWRYFPVIRSFLGRALGASALGGSVAVISATQAFTQSTDDVTATMFPTDILPFAAASIALGGTIAAIVAATMFSRERRRKKQEIRSFATKAAILEKRANAFEGFLTATRQCVVVVDAFGGKPDVSGPLPEGKGIPRTLDAFLNFEEWMTSQSCAVFEEALLMLRETGTPFEARIDTPQESALHVSGRVSGAELILRFQDASRIEAEYAHQKNRADELEERLTTIQNLLDELKEPVWMRDTKGEITWGNRAYFRVSGPDHELLSASVREKIAGTHSVGEPYHGKTTAIFGGDRHILDVTASYGPAGTAGIAMDATENEMLRSELKRIIQGYSETFDQLSTAVAIFDPSMKLEFFNQAFATLWPLEPPFLESRPSHALILDRLREKGILNESPDWRQWKEDLFEAYRAVEPRLHIWNLPDGRTLRVVANPHPQGGVTWLFEDLTEKLSLETRYNTLIKMQGETLDNLCEGVAVFGPDGRMRLSNPAFAKVWQLPAEFCVEGTHIARIEGYCLHLADGQEWSNLTAVVTGFADRREEVSGRMDLFSGAVLDYALVPLPQGQAMLTFVDVTDSVNVARALHDRNEALEFADQLRNDFVSHVSYELRTPLTNIIGFTDLLRTPAFGPLNSRQHEYLKHIASESVELLNIVNDILDLATVDAGIMELDIGEVNVTEAMQNAVSRIEERVRENNIRIEQNIAPGLASFSADGARVRQVLFNVLSNAANFAPQNSVIHFSAHADCGDVVFTVHDDGAGIPDEILDTVFKRFSAHAHHGGKPGAGLGLSIVKSFVELHHGTVDIKTGADIGTTVICRFPASAPLLRIAAE